MRRLSIHFLLLVSAGWAGCSSDRSVFEDAPSQLGGIDGGLDGAGGCTGVVCSRDLRSVRDCSGNLVKACEADKACGKGECVAPCDAAAMSEGSLGCSFAIPTPIEDGAAHGSCAAVFVANNWSSSATLHLESNGEERSLDGAVWVPFVEDGAVKHRKLEGPIPPGGGAVVFVSNEVTDASKWVACPVGVKPVFDKAPALYGTGISHALFASANVPVAMYSMYPYGGAKSNTPSGTLLLPTTSFGKNYVLVSSWGGAGDAFGSGVLTSGTAEQPGRPTLQILAMEDDTSIDLLPKVEIVGGRGIPPSQPNQVANFRLQRGEILQLTQQKELVGSILEASKPVGVFGGHTCMHVPKDIAHCDADNKQLPPLSVWGHEYAVLPAPDRVRLTNSRTQRSGEPSVVRMVGAANGTSLVYEPFKPEGAPDTLEVGQLGRFFVNAPFVVRSQDSAHPFYVNALMLGTGASVSGTGDPESSMAIPTDQWLDSYGFFSDYTYAYSAIFVTRRKSNGAFKDVTLDCAGVITDWEPITADYEWTYLELSRAKHPRTYPGGTCTDGPHSISSDGPFTMAVWGVDVAASYSYAGGMGLRRATELYVPVH